MYVDRVKKGGYICLESRGKECTWIQCQCCGYIYQIADKISIEKSIVKSTCPKCKGKVGLNCGDKEEDIAIFYDPYLDERYFNY